MWSTIWLLITTSPLKLVNSPSWLWVTGTSSTTRDIPKPTKLTTTCSDSYLQDSGTVLFHPVSLAVGLTVQGKFLLQHLRVQSSKTQLLFIFLHNVHYLHIFLPHSFPDMFSYLSQEVPKLQTDGGCEKVLEVYYYMLALILCCSLHIHCWVARESNKT